MSPLTIQVPGFGLEQGFLQEGLRRLHILSEEKEKELKTFERALSYFLFLQVTFPEAAPLQVRKLKVRGVKCHTKGQVWKGSPACTSPQCPRSGLRCCS